MIKRTTTAEMIKRDTAIAALRLALADIEDLDVNVVIPSGAGAVVEVSPELYIRVEMRFVSVVRAADGEDAR